MTLFDLMGIASTVALALPVIFLIGSRLAWYKCLPALLAYSILVFVHNLMALGYIQAPNQFIQTHGLFNNLVDAPLILGFLTYFSQTAAHRKSILICLGIFLGFECIVLLIFGFNKTSNTIIMAPGLLLVLVISFIFFVHYVKLSLVNQKALGKLLMITSVLVAYFIYTFIYVVFYLMETRFVDDTKLIYFMCTTFSSLVLCVGLIIEQRRVRHLSELHKTRAELKALYGESEANTTIPFETVVFKFEKGNTY